MTTQKVKIITYVM